MTVTYLSMTSSTTPILVRDGMAWCKRSQPPADVSVLKSSGKSIRSYGCGKGLSIAAPSNETAGISGFRLSVRRVNPRDPLGTHLGFNRGSFSRTFPDGVLIAQLLVGGSRG